MNDVLVDPCSQRIRAVINWLHPNESYYSGCLWREALDYSDDELSDDAVAVAAVNDPDCCCDANYDDDYGAMSFVSQHPNCCCCNCSSLLKTADSFDHRNRNRCSNLDRCTRHSSDYLSPDE